MSFRVYIFQLIRYSRACRSYQDFLDRGLLLTRKLLNQGFLLVKLKSLPRKLYSRNHDLVDRYGISVSYLCSTFPDPFLIHDLSQVLELDQHDGCLNLSPVLSGIRVTLIFSFMCMFCRSFFVLFLVIVLSVLLRYTDSDCSFGIFKLFLSLQNSIYRNCFNSCL